MKQFSSIISPLINASRARSGCCSLNVTRVSDNKGYRPHLLNTPLVVFAIHSHWTSPQTFQVDSLSAETRSAFSALHTALKAQTQQSYSVAIDLDQLENEVSLPCFVCLELRGPVGSLIGSWPIVATSLRIATLNQMVESIFNIPCERLEMSVESHGNQKEHAVSRKVIDSEGIQLLDFLSAIATPESGLISSPTLAIDTLGIAQHPKVTLRVAISEPLSTDTPNPLEVVAVPRLISVTVRSIIGMPLTSFSIDLDTSLHDLREKTRTACGSSVDVSHFTLDGKSLDMDIPEDQDGRKLSTFLSNKNAENVVVRLCRPPPSSSQSTVDYRMAMARGDEDSTELEDEYSRRHTVTSSHIAHASQIHDSNDINEAIDQSKRRSLVFGDKFVLRRAAIDRSSDESQKEALGIPKKRSPPPDKPSETTHAHSWRPAFNNTAGRSPRQSSNRQAWPNFHSSDRNQSKAAAAAEESPHSGLRESLLSEMNSSDFDEASLDMVIPFERYT